MQPEKRDAPELDRILKYEKKRKENWHRDERGQAPREAGEGTHTRFLIHLHYRFTLLHRILELLLGSSKLGLKLLHFEARSHRTLIQRPKRKPDQDPENHQHPTIGQIEPIMHPEKRLNDFGCNRMDNALKKAPPVRIDVIEILAHSREALRFLSLIHI